MLSGTYERITARTVSVDMHFNIPCSNARDMPNVLLPVPGQPLIKISLGGCFASRNGVGELNVRRCFMPVADKEVMGRAETKMLVDRDTWETVACGECGAGLKARADEAIHRRT